MNKILMLSIVLVLNTTIFAQSYTFTFQNETYTDLESSVSLNNGMTWSYPNYTIPIGFNFQFFNQNLNSFYIVEDFDVSILTSSNNLGNTMASVVPFGTNLMDRGWDINSSSPTENSLSPLSYQIEGTVGNRIFKMEWKNVGFSGEIWDYEHMATDYANFQLWCYESSNIIEIRFGESHFEHYDSSFYDESGPLIGLFPSINEDGPTQNGFVLTGSPSNPSLLNTMSTIFLNGMPPNGIVYRFTPDTAGIDDYNDNLALTLSPIPVDGFFKVATFQEDLEIEKISIFNLLGQFIQSEKSDFEKIDVSTLLAGVYMVNVYTNRGVKSIKMIKN